MPHRLPALHRAIVVVDVAGFTDPARTLVHQSAVHEGLYEVLDQAFVDAGVDLDTCTREDRGDGAMILVPPDVPKSVLASRLPGALVAALRRYNAVHSAGAAVQLRMVLHAGEVRADANGMVSPAINVAFRILEATEAKEALQESAGVLAVIASELFFQDVIAHDPGADPGSYRQIPVQVKGTSTTAWLMLPDVAAPTTQVLGQVDSVPLVWGSVPPRNPIFTGRGELLDQLGHLLASRGAAAVLSAALHGMGGVGKTQIAVEYIYRRLHHYDIVWWVRATQPAQIRAGLTELAQFLRLPGCTEAKTAVPAVREALRLGQPYRRWLLVFDSAEMPDIVRPFLPTNGPGEILITSRNPNWVGIARRLEVAVFNRDESVELLKRRGLEIDNEEAEQLAEKLGDLPLAIEQAAAWGAETGMPVQEYLRLFDEKLEEIPPSRPTTRYR